MEASGAKMVEVTSQLYLVALPALVGDLLSFLKSEKPVGLE